VTTDWEPIEVERVYGDYLLRVCRTFSPNRFRWFAVPIVEVKKGSRWFYGGDMPGKGASRAVAKGYSSSFENAQRDAIAMVEAIMKSEPVTS
jgi:hypothetical protein